MILRRMPLKSSVQEVQKEEEKQSRSRNISDGALPKPVYEMIIMSHKFLGWTQYIIHYGLSK